MSFLDTIKNDALKFEGVVIKPEQELKAELEKIFGSGNVDTAISQAEAAAATELGSLAKDAVLFVESKLKSVAGATKFSTAEAIILSVAKALGLSLNLSTIDGAIQTFVPFLAHAAVAAATAGL